MNHVALIEPLTRLLRPRARILCTGGAALTDALGLRALGHEVECLVANASTHPGAFPGLRPATHPAETFRDAGFSVREATDLRLSSLPKEHFDAIFCPALLPTDEASAERTLALFFQALRPGTGYLTLTLVPHGSAAAPNAIAAQAQPMPRDLTEGDCERLFRRSGFSVSLRAQSESTAPPTLAWILKRA